MKKQDLPWMKWFWGDWFKCPEIRALKPETRCAWFEMLGLMWESTEKGYLTLNKNPYPIDCLARCLGFAQANLEQSISEMESFNVFSRRADGAIYNRRMIADCELSEKRALAGEKGGICSSKTQAKLKQSGEQTTKQPLIYDSDSESNLDSCIKKKKRKKEATTLHTFSDSPYYDIKAFMDKTEWAEDKAKYYWNQLDFGAKTKGYKYLDWSLVAKKWAGRDEEAGKPFISTKQKPLGRFTKNGIPLDEENPHDQEMMASKNDKQ